MCIYISFSRTCTPHPVKRAIGILHTACKYEFDEMLGLTAVHAVYFSFFFQIEYCNGMGLIPRLRKEAVNQCIYFGSKGYELGGQKPLFHSSGGVSTILNQLRFTFSSKVYSRVYSAVADVGIFLEIRGSFVKKKT